MFWLVLAVGVVRAIFGRDPRRLRTYVTHDSLAFMAAVEADRAKWIRDCHAGRRRWGDFPYAY